MTADQIIARLGLAPHPEGGWYRQSWAAPVATAEGRACATCIHFLLKAGERSHWHRVDGDEIWLYHAGAPLILSLAADAAGPARDLELGPDLSRALPQRIVPAGHWQAARSLGAFTLVSCVVAPGFRFEGFELAAPGFDIPRG